MQDKKRTVGDFLLVSSGPLILGKIIRRQDLEINNLANNRADLLREVDRSQVDLALQILDNQKRRSAAGDTSMLHDSVDVVEKLKRSIGNAQ